MNKRTIVAPESKTQKMVEVSEDVQPSRDIMTASHRKALARYEYKKEFLYPVEKIAQDNVCIMNVKFPGADEAYPQVHEALFRFVSKLFPNAKGGPLYVDQPKNEKEVYRAYERHKVMIKLKLRHIIAEKDSSYEHLLEQLEECTFIKPPMPVETAEDLT